MRTALKAGSSSKWYLNSGCSRHMIGDRTNFCNYSEFDGGSITFRDGSSTKIIGQGTIVGPGLPKIENV
ncbi:hypothetical protein PJP10_31920, partial [Mycobacterium kansasii]